MLFRSVAVDLPPGAFMQASRAGEQAIVAAAQTALGGARRVADLYAGAGALALSLASGRRALYAAERNKAAIAALEQGARRSGLGSILRAEARDLARRPLIGEELERFDAVIFDPPREGAAEQARALAAAKLGNDPHNQEIAQCMLMDYGTNQLAGRDKLLLAAAYHTAMHRKYGDPLEPAKRFEIGRAHV